MTKRDILKMQTDTFMLQLFLLRSTQRRIDRLRYLIARN